MAEPQKGLNGIVVSQPDLAAVQRGSPQPRRAIVRLESAPCRPKSVSGAAREGLRSQAMDSSRVAQGTQGRPPNHRSPPRRSSGSAPSTAWRRKQPRCSGSADRLSPAGRCKDASCPSTANASRPRQASLSIVERICDDSSRLPRSHPAGMTPRSCRLARQEVFVNRPCTVRGGCRFHPTALSQGRSRHRGDSRDRPYQETPQRTAPVACRLSHHAPGHRAAPSRRLSPLGGRRQKKKPSPRAWPTPAPPTSGSSSRAGPIWAFRPCWHVSRRPRSSTADGSEAARTPATSSRARPEEETIPGRTPGSFRRGREPVDGGRRGRPAYAGLRSSLFQGGFSRVAGRLSRRNRRIAESLGPRQFHRRRCQTFPDLARLASPNCDASSTNPGRSSAAWPSPGLTSGLLRPQSIPRICQSVRHVTSALLRRLFLLFVVSFAGEYDHEPKRFQPCRGPCNRRVGRDDCPSRLRLAELPSRSRGNHAAPI